jgi:hypothetical protein
LITVAAPQGGRGAAPGAPPSISPLSDDRVVALSGRLSSKEMDLAAADLIHHLAASAALQGRGGRVVLELAPVRNSAAEQVNTLYLQKALARQIYEARGLRLLADEAQGQRIARLRRAGGAGPGPSAAPEAELVVDCELNASQRREGARQQRRYWIKLEVREASSGAVVYSRTEQVVKEIRAGSRAPARRY